MSESENKSKLNDLPMFPSNLKLPVILSALVFVLMLIAYFIASVIFGVDISRLIF